MIDNESAKRSVLYNPDAQMTAQKVMAVSGHRSEIQMRRDYPMYFLMIRLG